MTACPGCRGNLGVAREFWGGCPILSVALGTLPLIHHLKSVRHTFGRFKLQRLVPIDRDAGLELCPNSVPRDGW
jgi:hypothetical protein